MTPAPPGERMLAVLGWPGLTDAEKVVVAILAYHDGAQGAYPSVALLERETGLSRAMVFRRLKRLQGKGAISRRKTRTVNVYTIHYGAKLSQHGDTAMPSQHSDTAGLSQNEDLAVSESTPSCLNMVRHRREENRKEEGKKYTPQAPLKGGLTPRELPQTRLGFRDGLIGRRQFIEARDYWADQGGDLLAMLAADPEGARKAAGLWRRSKGYGPEADEA